MNPRALHRRSLLKAAAALPFFAALRAQERPEAPPPPELVDPDRGPGAGWSMLVFPDTQNYAKYAKNQAHFDRMTRWVREHRKAWNIRLALHEGDLVEQNDIKVGGGRGYGDQNSESQWASARRALLPLADEMPVIHTTGNHDYGERAAETRDTRFNDYFPVNYNPGAAALRIESPLAACGKPTLENAAYDFKAPDGRRLRSFPSNGDRANPSSTGRPPWCVGPPTRITPDFCSCTITSPRPTSVTGRTAIASVPAILTPTARADRETPMTARTSGSVS